MATSQRVLHISDACRTPAGRLAVPMDLDLESTRRGSASVLTLRGEVDVYTAPRLRQAIVDLVDAGSPLVVVDMANVDFLDSTGLGVLVEGLKRARARSSDLAIVATQDKILKIFDITGLNKAFAIHRTVDDAVGKPTPEG
jgi:anti-sigma B factor antagonist